jgi:DNA-binding FadR family transcriptional regulator
MLQPVIRRSVTEAVFDQLKSVILRGEVPAGEKLPAERDLAARLGVNRNAVREALQRLVQLRLVSVQAGGATRVLDFKAHAGLELLSSLLFGADGAVRADAIRSMVELRTALGPDIAARAATRRPDAMVPRLLALVDRMAEIEDGDPVRLQHVTLELWRTLVDASGNLAYPLLMNTLDHAYRGVADVVAPALADELRDVAGHRALVRAIEAGDATRARRAAERLLAKGEAGIHALVEPTGRKTKEKR